MKISDLSKLTKVSTRAIRYYDKKGLITSYRLNYGYRDFDDSAIERIKEIQLYLSLGLTTEQIDFNRKLYSRLSSTGNVRFL